MTTQGGSIQPWPTGGESNRDPVSCSGHCRNHCFFSKGKARRLFQLLLCTLMTLEDIISTVKAIPDAHTHDCSQRVPVQTGMTVQEWCG